MSEAPTVINAGGLVVYTVPKAGGSAIKRAVLAGLGFSGAAVRVHRHAALGLTTVAGAGDGYRVAFVRHPLDRLVSAWADKVARRKPGGTANLERLGYRVGMSFCDFAWLAVDLAELDVHTRRQAGLIVPPERLDVLARLEAIDKVWPALRRRFDWLAPLGRANASPRHRSWRVYYSDEVEAAVRAAYADDLALWEAAACNLS